MLCLCATGHNSDGKFIARAQRIEFDCELIPRRVAIFIEKTKDGQVLPVPNVVARDVACGANHTVSYPQSDALGTSLSNTLVTLLYFLEEITQGPLKIKNKKH